jgi:putative PIN family toxin of toxin-antitoxin system
MITAVLDTNVLVSAAIKAGGIPAQFIAYAEEHFIWLTSEYILDETAGVLARKHIQTRYRQRVTTARRNDFLTEVRRAAIIVEVKTKLSASADVKDDPVLASAVDGSANYLVTGDRDLLELGTYQEIQIVTPAEFLKIRSEQ